jgi:hydroxymethylbilane synthase
MWDKKVRIGTRDSRLAVWQAMQVQNLLETNGYKTELIHITSEGDVDLITPLYAMGVQGVFTRSLDAALLNNKIDIAVHSMKDVPVQLPQGIVQAAVLPRASHKDILVYKEGFDIHSLISDTESKMVIATSSIRRKAQWLLRFPNSHIENLRGNVNTRLRKVAENNWHGAIFASAGLERIGVRPDNSIDLDWMLPAPAQGAIMVVCRKEDMEIREACTLLSDVDTEIAVKVERDFLSALMGGCSTPISALAVIRNGLLLFKGNVVLPNGKQKAKVEKIFQINDYNEVGKIAAKILLQNGGQEILAKMK